MSHYNFRYKIVVRRSKKTGKFYANNAGALPLRYYDHVAVFGSWMGTQTPWKPCQEAWRRAYETADKLNQAQQRKESLYQLWEKNE